MRTAWVFPGQGSQAVGMGKALAGAFPVARACFEEADDALSFHLSRLMFEGPEETLTLTENAQPAIVACSLAALAVLEQEMGLKADKNAVFLAGHSLGEYAALAAAGVFSRADAVRLVRLRGQAMQRAVPAGQGAMAALLGLEMDVVEALVQEAGGDVCLANDNAPGQIVISGEAEAIARAIELAKAKGAKRALPLAVSAPFHSPLMAPAAATMKNALAATEMHPATPPVIANITARPVATPEDIRTLLVEQVTGRVRWRESVQFMAGEGQVTRFVEIGAGKVLSGLIKRIAPDAATHALGEPQDFDAFQSVAA